MSAKPPSLSESFKACTAYRAADAVLGVNNGVGFYIYYDFAQRMIMTQHGQIFSPFNEVDPEVLQAARDKLISMGGNPPELPGAGADSAPKPAKGGLNL